MLRGFAPTILIILILGLSMLVGFQLSAALQLPYLVAVGVFAAAAAFDQSRGRWPSVAAIVLLVLATGAILSDTKLVSVAWLAYIAISLSVMVALTQAKINKSIVVVISILIAIGATLPSIVMSEIIRLDTQGDLVVTIALLSSLLPFATQYFPAYRTQVVWVATSLQQFILRLAFFVWFVNWKPTLVSTNLYEKYSLIVLTALAFLLFFLNFFSEKTKSAYVQQTTNTLFIILVILSKNHMAQMAALAATSMSAFYAIAPSAALNSKKKEALSYLEQGAMGGGTWLLLLCALIWINESADAYSYAIILVLYFAFGAQMWRQRGGAEMWGAQESQGRLWWKMRGVLQVTLILLVVLMYTLLEKWQGGA